MIEKLRDYLLIHELPVLEILDAVLDDYVWDHRVKAEDKNEIVLTYGRALKTALDMKREEANAARGSNDGGDGGGLSALRGDAPEVDAGGPGEAD